MQRAARLTWLGAALFLLAALAALTLAWLKLVPGDEELAERIRAQAEARLGVEVTLGSVHMKFWPRPELVIEDAATAQAQPIRIRRLVANPELGALLRGRLMLQQVRVDGAVLPQLSLRALRVQPAPQLEQEEAVHVAQLVFRDVVWITRFGTDLEFEGRAGFGPHWELRDAEVTRPGVRPIARLMLAPAAAGSWKVDLQIGGGTANGQVKLSTGRGGVLDLEGELAPRDIDVANGLAGFKRRSAIHGKASGQTRLSASGRSVGELARSLHTRTEFSLASARLLHIDVDKAIRTFGQERTGETALRSLTGRMDTQNTQAGMVVRYTGLQARGETFSASGGGSIANRRVEGELTVDLAGGLVGVPLKVSGPLAKPEVTVSGRGMAGAAAGAAVGTAVLPGIGTAIGAGVGAAIGKIFGGEPRKSPAPAR